MTQGRHSKITSLSAIHVVDAYYAHKHLVLDGHLQGIQVMEAHGIKLSDFKTTSQPAEDFAQGKDMMHNGISYKYIYNCMYAYQ